MMIAEGTLGAPNGASLSQKHGNDMILHIRPHRGVGTQIYDKKAN